MTASKGLRPALLFLSSDDRFDLGTETLKGDEAVKRLKRVALRADRLETFVEIVKSQLPHGVSPAQSIIVQHRI